MSGATRRLRRGQAARLRIHEVDNNELVVHPRHDPPCSDDLVLCVRHITTQHGGSILLTRAKATELYEFLGKWLATGWPGVPQEQGESTADVIEHFQAIATREKIAADHARTGAAREVDAALVLIPPDRRTADLTAIAAAQSRAWRRMQHEADHHRRSRDLLVQDMVTLEFATGLDGNEMRRAIRRALDRNGKHPTEPKARDQDAPFYVEADLHEEGTNG